MAKLTFKEDVCKGCGLCVLACPKKILEISKTRLNRKGHAPARAAPWRGGVVLHQVWLDSRLRLCPKEFIVTQRRNAVFFCELPA